MPGARHPVHEPTFKSWGGDPSAVSFGLDLQSASAPSLRLLLSRSLNETFGWFERDPGAMIRELAECIDFMH